MARKILEGCLQLTVSNSVSFRKFDDPAVHGLSYCMKAVDFIIDLGGKYLFLEIKDPEHPEARSSDRDRFIENFKSGRLDQDLKVKCRDTFLYEWASGRADKPIIFCVVLASRRLTSAELLTRSDSLKKLLPINAPNGEPWVRPFIQDCVVVDIDSWNKYFPSIRISRAKSTKA
jgi:hypothetical protein